MKKLNRLIKEPAIITAGNLKISLRQAYNLKGAIETGSYGTILKEQFQLLYKHYGLTPNDVIDYKPWE